MSRGVGLDLRHALGFPRVSGDEPDLIDYMKPTITFSPREWG